MACGGWEGIGSALVLIRDLPDVWISLDMISPVHIFTNPSIIPLTILEHCDVENRTPLLAMSNLTFLAKVHDMPLVDEERNWPYKILAIDFNQVYFFLVGEGTVFTQFLYPREYRTFSCLTFTIFGRRCFFLVTVTGGRSVSVIKSICTLPITSYPGRLFSPKCALARWWSSFVIVTTVGEQPVDTSTTLTLVLSGILVFLIRIFLS